MTETNFPLTIVTQNMIPEHKIAALLLLITMRIMRFGNAASKGRAKIYNKRNKNAEQQKTTVLCSYLPINLYAQCYIYNYYLNEVLQTLNPSMKKYKRRTIIQEKFNPIIAIDWILMIIMNCCHDNTIFNDISNMTANTKELAKHFQNMQINELDLEKANQYLKMYCEPSQEEINPFDKANEDIFNAISINLFNDIQTQTQALQNKFQIKNPIQINFDPMLMQGQLIYEKFVKCFNELRNRTINHKYLEQEKTKSLCSVYGLFLHEMQTNLIGIMKLVSD